jgi:hypothetical protein
LISSESPVAKAAMAPGIMDPSYVSVGQFSRLERSFLNKAYL